VVRGASNRATKVKTKRRVEPPAARAQFFTKYM
jgi:hypothetical protein